MSTTRFIEDAFLELANLVTNGHIAYWHADASPVMSFQQALDSGSGITKRQADFMLKLVRKYRKELEKSLGTDVSDLIDNPLWKNSFREIDYSKRISIEFEEDGKPYIHIRFPFSLKENFQKEFADNRGKTPTVWDNEQKVQKAALHDINHIRLYEYGKKNEFEFSENFVNFVEQVEEIWSDEVDLSPHCVVEDKNVLLVNANTNATTYFENHKTGQLIEDLHLAKIMGFPMAKSQEKSKIFEIFSTMETKFWTNDIKKITGLLKELNTCPIVIFLDRGQDSMDWAKTVFYHFQAEKLDVDGMRVCFRFPKDDPEGTEFNQWVKENNLGGSIESGKIFICQHKPPKWMLKGDFSPKIVISNSLYPQTNIVASSMINSHHTVFYIGKVKPSVNKDTKIVEL